MAVRKVTVSVRRSSSFEGLEGRQFLSASALAANVRLPGTDVRHVAAGHATAFTQYQIVGGRAAKARGGSRVTPAAGYATPVGKTPAQVRKAYGIDAVTFGGVVGDGSGQTIAIIDAYDDPSMVSSTNASFLISDLHRFDVQFGIQDPPSFTKVSQTGSQTALPAYNSGWAGEIALDVEWAHAMAPKASIVLVEAASASGSNLNAAVNYAKSLPGVSVVSMSYGMNEYSGETLSDSIYKTTGGHTGVSFFASTGDAGAPGSYQAYSPNVVAVGGTSLYLDSSGNYSSESGWSGSGGGISLYESKPGYQSGVTQSSTKRATPDVSAVADPNTGVAILETSAGGIGSVGGWMQIGGTSLAAPLWAGMMSIVDQGRALQGLGTLDGATQTLPRIYSLNATDFHDVTTGSNGTFSAGAGYDLVTGRGTPRADQLLPDLAGAATISGVVYDDANGNALRDNGESYIPNATIYLDLNNNGVKDAAEPSGVTGTTGAYSFSDLLGRVSYTVREAMPSGYVSTTPTVLTLSSSYGTTTAGNFGVATTPQTSFGGKAITLRMDAAGSNVEVYNNTAATGTPAYTVSKSLVTALTFAGTAGDDSFSVDLSNGNPLAGLNVSYDGAGGADTVSVLGTAAANAAAFSDTAITLDGGTLNTANTEADVFDGRNGLDTVSVTGATPVTFATSQELGSLSLAAGTKATLAAGRQNLYTRALSVGAGAALDLTDGNLIVDDAAGAAGAVRSALTGGYAGGAWNGGGINSSAAASDARRETALGYLTAGDLAVTTYNGYAVTASAVIVRYTYYGDATLNGSVDADDVALTDRGRAKGLSGWLFGDFNYDSATTAADYTLQSQPLQAASPAIV